jgi:hypothetical protein
MKWRLTKTSFQLIWVTFESLVRALKTGFAAFIFFIKKYLVHCEMEEAHFDS